MSDLQVHVRDNLEALSADMLHRALVGLVRDTVHEMAILARGIAPKRGGLMAEHIKEEDVIEVAELVSARLGVTHVDEADARHSAGEYKRSSYPLFVHGGTRSKIFPAKASAMWNIAEGIFGRKEVSGQKPQPFMLAAYTQARAILHSDPQILRALKEMAAEAAALRAEIEAT